MSSTASTLISLVFGCFGSFDSLPGQDLGCLYFNVASVIFLLHLSHLTCCNSFTSLGVSSGSTFKTSNISIGRDISDSSDDSTIWTGIILSF